jgi:hypothetical protein
MLLTIKLVNIWNFYKKLWVERVPTFFHFWGMHSQKFYCVNHNNMSLAIHILVLCFFLRFLPNNRENMKFLLNGIKQTHKDYDEIANECGKTLDSSDCRDFILKRFLLEKRAREMTNVKLVSYCSKKQLNYFGVVRKWRHARVGRGKPSMTNFHFMRLEWEFDPY